MSVGLSLYPFDRERLVGTVCEVGPNSAKVNLPFAAATEAGMLYGNRVAKGEVGEFVFVESSDSAIFARVIQVRLPEGERLAVEPKLERQSAAHPLGTLQLLATISLLDGAIRSGVGEYPRLGASVYSAHPEMLKWLAESRSRGSDGNTVSLDLATLPGSEQTPVNFTPENLFGRHCAVLGATGGGKSWTIARIVEQTAKHDSKVILFDATGEFHTLDCNVRHVYLGSDPEPPVGSTEVSVPYSELTEMDLCALFSPSGQTQGPKLRTAMKSLKLAKLEPSLARGGLIMKVGSKKAGFEAAYRKHASVLESSATDFEIKHLARQIDEECVWGSGGTAASPDHGSWGNYNAMDKGYCFTLLARIEDMLSSKDLTCVFKPEGKPSLLGEIEQFLGAKDQRVLRVSLKHLGFAHDAREIVVNAVGRHLLKLARDGKCRVKPLFVFLDEAHQFLDKSLGDENSRLKLDAFDLIAKEGRKYALTICIATQRPRDIPEGVLSQMGTLIVHRLTNDHDRGVVERASGDIDRSAAAFLPTLAPGQAIVVGVDFPIPLTVQISKPRRKPDSRGPDYQSCWGSKLGDNSR